MKTRVTLYAGDLQSVPRSMPGYICSFPGTGPLKAAAAGCGEGP